MRALEGESRQPVRDRLLAGDEVADLVRIVAIVVVYAVLDVGTRSTVALDSDDLRSPFLALRAVTRHPLPVVALAALLVVVARWGRGSLLVGWTALENGAALRWLASPAIVLMAWYGSAYEYNYFIDQWHVADRLLVLGLAAAVWYRPIFLVPFVLQVRIVEQQLFEPTGSSPSYNVAELLAVTLLVVAAVVLVVAATGQAESASLVLVLGTVVATHFFLPGRQKLVIDWMTTTDPPNFALASYTAGWMGAGDGGWARSLASIAGVMRWPLILGTIVLELGAAIAVYHRRLLRLWLPGWILFHIAIFLMSGFWLLEWVVVEVALLLLLARPAHGTWLSRNDTPARGILAVLVVAGLGPSLYHPPGLAWLDADVSYGYEIEAVGESGERYHVPLSAFAPLQEQLSFVFAHYRYRPEVVTGYGGVNNAWLFGQIEAVTSFDELAALEGRFDPVRPEVRARSEQIVLRWLDHVNRHGSPAWLPLHPFDRYWNSRAEPVFGFGERIERLEVVLVSSLHDDTNQRFSRSTVLVAEAHDGGAAVVVQRSGDGPTDG